MHEKNLLKMKIKCIGAKIISFKYENRTKIKDIPNQNFFTLLKFPTKSLHVYSQHLMFPWLMGKEENLRQEFFQYHVHLLPTIIPYLCLREEVILSLEED